MNPALTKSADRVLGSALGAVLGWIDGVKGLIAPPGPVSRVDRMLVIKFWGLGNWALLRPVVGSLKARYPAARLTIATLAGNRSLVEDLADDLLLVRTSSMRGTLGDLSRAVRFLRRHPHELALDFEQFARAGALLARLGRVAQRIGFAAGSNARDGLYTVAVPFDPNVHITRSFQDLAEAAGVEPGRAQPSGLVPDPRAVASLARRRGPTQGAVVLHPGSGDNFPGRRWSAAGFEAVGRAAIAAGARVFVTGGANELELAQRVAAGVGSGATCLAGDLTVAELVALMAGARVLVSNDTGPVHIASQLGVPVLAFYGPNTPVLYGPLSAGSRAFYRDLPCSPCLTNASYRSSRCRIYTCMETIPTGAVVAALRLLLVPTEDARA